MKKMLSFLILSVLCACISGCSHTGQPAQIVTTILPVYDVTSALCEGTDISVSRLVTEEVSCLHDYTLQVGQMRTVSSAELIVTSGAGFEAFLEDILTNSSIIVEAAAGVPLLTPSCDQEHTHAHNHTHEHDPHIWLSPENVGIMAENICKALCRQYPQYNETFNKNLTAYKCKLNDLSLYAKESLQDIPCRQLITFHDGFSYLADAFDLEIIHAIEEESGSEASAAELIRLVNMVKEHSLPAIFTERNGSSSAANVIAKEVNVPIYTLDMAVSGDSYFDAMYHNIDTLKEAMQ